MNDLRLAAGNPQDGDEGCHDERILEVLLANEGLRSLSENGDTRGRGMKLCESFFTASSIAELKTPAVEGGGNSAKSGIAMGNKIYMINSEIKLKGQRRSKCAFSEEPAAVIPHAGVCEEAPDNRCPYLKG